MMSCACLWEGSNPRPAQGADEAATPLGNSRTDTDTQTQTTFDLRLATCDPKAKAL